MDAWYIYIYTVHELTSQHRICDFSMPQLNRKANKHETWLHFMLISHMYKKCVYIYIYTYLCDLCVYVNCAYIYIYMYI